MALMIRSWLFLTALLFISGQPTAAAAAGQCAMVGRQNEREVLFNRCETCQIVTLTHKRPGPDPAVTRKYTVPGKSDTDLSFRGPGVTRIQSVTPCIAPPPPSPAADGETDGKQCAQLQRRVDGGLVIINSCNACREVVAERTGPGKFAAKETYTIAGKSYIPLSTKGGNEADIISDKVCR